MWSKEAGQPADTSHRFACLPLAAAASSSSSSWCATVALARMFWLKGMSAPMVWLLGSYLLMSLESSTAKKCCTWNLRWVQGRAGQAVVGQAGVRRERQRRQQHCKDFVGAMQAAAPTRGSELQKSHQTCRSWLQPLHTGRGGSRKSRPAAEKGGKPDAVAAAAAHLLRT